VSDDCVRGREGEREMEGGREEGRERIVSARDAQVGYHKQDPVLWRSRGGGEKGLKGAGVFIHWR
jgi:hypothetical protein